MIIGRIKHLGYYLCVSAFLYRAGILTLDEEKIAFQTVTTENRGTFSSSVSLSALKDRREKGGEGTLRRYMGVKSPTIGKNTPDITFDAGVLFILRFFSPHRLRIPFSPDDMPAMRCPR